MKAVGEQVPDEGEQAELSETAESGERAENREETLNKRIKTLERL